jgi:hypothetical protein
MTAEDICWRTAAAACLPNALRQGASRAPREKILGAQHEAWRVFSRRNRKRETSRPIAFAGECSTACMVSVAARPIANDCSIASRRSEVRR